ncbi:hypothetical protein [Shouchella miscanthi]|uniref:hypothetical protein n=1 Tax=Shouchella miscanthi TaxID=2598861 RepID=UPI0011A9CEE4|nr:hypothetical protein [Shouchella miscanthi]
MNETKVVLEFDSSSIVEVNEMMQECIKNSQELKAVTEKTTQSYNQLNKAISKVRDNQLFRS